LPSTISPIDFQPHYWTDADAAAADAGVDSDSCRNEILQSPSNEQGFMLIEITFHRPSIMPSVEGEIKE